MPPVGLGVFCRFAFGGLLSFRFHSIFSSLLAGSQMPRVTPGFMVTMSRPGDSLCSSAGLPGNTGKVSKCMGMTVLGLSRLQAEAASLGAMVEWAPMGSITILAA